MPSRPNGTPFSWKWTPSWAVPLLAISGLLAHAAITSKWEAGAVLVRALAFGAVAALPFLALTATSKLAGLRDSTLRGGVVGGLVVALPLWGLFGWSAVQSALAGPQGYGLLAAGYLVLYSPVIVCSGVLVGAILGSLQRV